MSQKVELELLRKSKREEQLNDLLNGIREMKKLYDQMKEEGFSDEFIAIYFTQLMKG